MRCYRRVVADDELQLGAVPGELYGDDVLVDCRTVPLEDAVDRLVYEVLVSRRAATLTFLSSTPDISVAAQASCDRYRVSDRLRVEP